MDEGNNKVDTNQVLQLSNQDRTLHTGFKLDRFRYKEDRGLEIGLLMSGTD